MAGVQEYKCPACGGGIQFDSASQKMKCPFCDNEFDLETLKQFDEVLKDTPAEDMTWETQAGTEWQEGETGNMAVYSCKSCG
ncbi:MAG TPA: hypothetical protein PLZ77_08770, partial [Lachnospiraceae bacterium]|nr:hypothetical protein [Lachnospiraceae bacterium]